MVETEPSSVETTGESGRSSDADDGRDSALAQATALTAAELGRSIIFRADIAVAVPDVAAAGREATQHIEALGGIVFEAPLAATVALSIGWATLMPVVMTLAERLNGFDATPARAQP